MTAFPFNRNLTREISMNSIRFTVFAVSLVVICTIGRLFGMTHGDGE